MKINGEFFLVLGKIKRSIAAGAITNALFATISERSVAGLNNASN